MSAPASNPSLHRFGLKAWAGAVRGGLRPFGRTFGRNSPAGLAPDVPGVVFGGLRNTRFGRFLRRHPTAVDLGLVLLLAVMSEPAAFNAPHDRALHVALAGLVLLPLVWRRRFPVLVFLATCAVALVQFLFDLIGESDVAVLVAFYTVAATCRRRVTYAAAVVVAVGTVLASIRLAEEPEGKFVAGLIFLSALAVTAGVLGINVGTRRMHL
nr:hypothetical protein [Micromonospora sp. DSM 115978]